MNDSLKNKMSIFEPILTVDDLDRFLNDRLSVSLPWDVVDQDSTSAPLKLVWSVYKQMLTGEGPPRHVIAASRNSQKTLTSSLIQFLAILHMRRDGAHIASTLDQSAQAILYLDEFISKIPELAPYRVVDNARTKRLVGLPPTDYTKIKPNAQIRVVTATKKGANSPRASCFAGPTKVLVYRDVPKDGVGRFNVLSMDGIYRRFNRGEQITVAAVDPITGQIKPAKVTATKRSERLDRLIITTESGKTIECTEDHWLAHSYDEGGIVYEQAGKLSIGDTLISKAARSFAISGVGEKTLTDFHHADYAPFDPASFSPQEMLDGLMLGDGCVARKWDKSACKYIGDANFTMTKSPKAAGYSQWVSGSPACQFWFKNHNLQRDKISSITKKTARAGSRNRWVYDVTVENYHNFFANQVLAHNCLTFDEVDLTPQEILSEAAYIADPTRCGNNFDPIFIYLSSRKTNDGPIQLLIDQASAPDAASRIKLHKWSLADFTERCPEERHRPDLGPQTAFMHSETLEVIWGDESSLRVKVPEHLRPAWDKISAFEGCKTCPAFIACQGRAVNQRGDSVALKKPSFIGGILESVGTPGVIIAQSLNKKPENTALVFKNYTPFKHLKDPISFYEWAVGSLFNPNSLSKEDLTRVLNEAADADIAQVTPTKDQIYDAMVQNGWEIMAGVDYGFLPDPAAVLIVGYHRKKKKAAVLHYEQAFEHANNVWADYVCGGPLWRFPVDFVAPDMSDKASPTYFGKHRIPCLNVKPPRIETGVSQIRGLLWNPLTQQSNFAILDDYDSDGKQHNYHVSQSFLYWSHKKNVLGSWDMDKFADDKWTHPLDCLRYALAPFVEDLESHIDVNQPRMSHELARAADEGDPEAMKIMEEKQKLHNQLNEHWLREYGIANVMAPAAPKTEPVKKKGGPTKKSTGFKFLY